VQNANYTVSQKTSHLTHDGNSSKPVPIFKTFSPLKRIFHTTSTDFQNLFTAKKNISHHI